MRFSRESRNYNDPDSPNEHFFVRLIHIAERLRGYTKYTVTRGVIIWQNSKCCRVFDLNAKLRLTQLFMSDCLCVTGTLLDGIYFRFGLRLFKWFIYRLIVVYFPLFKLLIRHAMPLAPMTNPLKNNNCVHYPAWMVKITWPNAVHMVYTFKCK